MLVLNLDRPTSKWITEAEKKTNLRGVENIFVVKNFKH